MSCHGHRFCRLGGRPTQPLMPPPQGGPNHIYIYICISIYIHICPSASLLGPPCTEATTTATVMASSDPSRPAVCMLKATACKITCYCHPQETLIHHNNLTHHPDDGHQDGLQDGPACVANQDGLQDGPDCLQDMAQHVSPTKMASKIAPTASQMASKMASEMAPKAHNPRPNDPNDPDDPTGRRCGRKPLHRRWTCASK